MSRVLAEMFFSFVVKFTIVVVLIALLGIPALNTVKRSLNDLGGNIGVQDITDPFSTLEKNLNSLTDN